MAYIITETCVDLKDRSCVDVCPVDCIIDGGAEDRMLVINPDECIDCGACVDPCPVAAIYPEDEVPAEMKRFIPWNFDYFKSDEDKARVRAEINAPTLRSARPKSHSQFVRYNQSWGCFVANVPSRPDPPHRWRGRRRKDSGKAEPTRAGIRLVRRPQEGSPEEQASH